MPIQNQMFEFFLGYTAGQRTATRSAALARSAAVADGTHTSRRIEDLDERVDKLVMIISALWELLEENGYSMSHLMEKLEQIDMADGQADGQIRSLPTDCPECGSKVAAGLAACQFCGTQVTHEEASPLDQI